MWPRRSFAGLRSLATNGDAVVDGGAEELLESVGEPDEIARLVVFLAGPGGAYITGTAIPVAGGNPVGL